MNSTRRGGVRLKRDRHPLWIAQFPIAGQHAAKGGNQARRVSISQFRVQKHAVNERRLLSRRFWNGNAHGRAPRTRKPAGLAQLKFVGMEKNLRTWPSHTGALGKPTPRKPVRRLHEESPSPPRGFLTNCRR